MVKYECGLRKRQGVYKVILNVLLFKQNVHIKFVYVIINKFNIDLDFELTFFKTRPILLMFIIFILVNFYCQMELGFPFKRQPSFNALRFAWLFFYLKRKGVTDMLKNNDIGMVGRLERFKRRAAQHSLTAKSKFDFVRNVQITSAGDRKAMKVKNNSQNSKI